MAKGKVLKLDAKEEIAEKVVELLIGASGTQFFTGFYNISDADEYNPDLKGKKALEAYNRMRKSDGQVKQALLALTYPILDAECRIVPPGDEEKGDKSTPQEIENTKYISDNFFASEFQWEEKLKQILTMFANGFSMFEKLYVYDGSKIKLKRLCQRIATSIVSWDVQNEELIQVKQFIYAGTTKREVWIPAEKIVLFVLDREGDDFRGQSALRAAYKHWFYKTTFERIQGMQIERWALGIPKIEQTDAIVGNPNKTKAIEMAKNLRAHEEAFAYVPKGFKLELLDSGTAKMIDPLGAINYHDASILKSIMASFLQLGQTSHGARSLGDTLMDMYLKSLKVASNYIAEVIGNSVFKEMTAWNYGPNVRPPKMQFNGIESSDLELIATAFADLIQSGAIEPDDKLEAYLRLKVGAPTKDVATIRKKAPPAIPGFPPTDGNPSEPPRSKKTPPGSTEPGMKAKRKKVSGQEFYSPTRTIPPKGMEEATYIQFWRPLTPAEQNISLREIVGKLDDTKERIVRATVKAREDVVSELSKKVDEVVRANDPSKIKDIDYSTKISDELIAAIRPILDDVMSYGEERVYEELKRQKKMTAAFPGNNGDTSDQIKKYLDSQAEQFSEISLDKLVDEARIQAGNAIRTGTYSAAAITSALNDFSENVVRKSAGYTVNEAFGFGRTQAANDLKDEIDHAEYSAILDNNTCPQCEALDGEEFEVDSPEYEQNSPPLYNCDGGSQCRCIWVYVGAGEQQPTE